MGGTFFGQRTGRRVDREISQWAKGGLGIHALKLKQPMHKYTTQLIKWFHAKGWTAVTSQYVVGSLEFGIGTPIDLLMRTKDGQLVEVEVKAGFDTYFETPTGNMKEPLQDVPCSPLNQARCQLIFSHFLLCATTALRPKQACVIVVNKTGVHPYSMTVDWHKDLIKDLQKKCIKKK
jgi:hypothetical protein